MSKVIVLFEAELLLSRGKADLIGIGRAMMRNPNWGMKS